MCRVESINRDGPNELPCELCDRFRYLHDVRVKLKVTKIRIWSLSALFGSTLNYFFLQDIANGFDNRVLN